MGPVSLKLYDKFGRILRIETTVNDPTFFRHYREVEHRDGSRETIMGFDAEDHLQPARAALTDGSRQRALPGVPIHRRGSARSDESGNKVWANWSSLPCSRLISQQAAICRARVQFAIPTKALATSL
jgi:hypothetical protein